MAFKIASSPHLSRSFKTSTLMQRVILCALPGVATQCYFFGWGVLIQVTIAIAVALLSEAVVLRLRKRPVVDTLKDNSALLTALLLGIAIPPLAPWWLIVIGVVFSIVVVKHLYGGLGHNIFNPAMAGYVMLLISFPVQMTSWVAPMMLASQPVDILGSLQLIFLNASASDIEAYKLGFDGLAMATPLDTIKTDLSMGLTSTESLSKSIFNDGFGVGWFWVNMAYFAGGLVMLKLKVIRWHIPAGILISLFVCASVGFLLNPDTHAGPLLHLFSGATMLAAFFIATDPVTAATSIRGRLLFGALIGLLVYMIRTYGGYPDAFAFAILLANLCAPFIDHYMKPRTYGHRSRN
ncbi:electron transport complex subunit RsxD [Shewanella sp. D64]|uniref:electron transport complex subunit RsxD n=1 Tax=unclassified Shewanella TaxID=196818 RepID=UPI0022BA158A|nr:MULTISPECIES: electron transport complex subunit RsxD [unclassified Shewanella]MEC4725262.1 electron transport complex subunit RsxD [Shewanella sp. D64]MEC4735892.1 electron transport complex subunit RsxD [Shewanella sp. E94]WBJ93140.1 electron transport complex subunit RsxD [Shewanella sp. MTB7]